MLFSQVFPDIRPQSIQELCDLQYPETE